MDNKEIELKFLISENTKKEILNDIEKCGKKTNESRLVDTYYIPNFKSFEVNGETAECLRIRESNGNCVLGYKKIHREADPVYCDEYETKIESKEQTEKILFALGFSTQMVIDKTRLSYKYKDLLFDFDSVKNLGEILEVELTDNSKDVNDIFEFVKKYNLTKKDVTYEGIQMLMKKSQNI